MPVAGRTCLVARAALVAVLALRAGAQLQPQFPVPAWPTSGTGNGDAAAADLDLDGRTDLVLLQQVLGADVVSVALALPGGGFGPCTDVPSPFARLDVAVGRLETDAWPDVVVLDALGFKVFVLRGTGAGALSAPLPYPVTGTARCLALGDVNGDALMDLVTGTAPSPVALNVNAANGTAGFLSTVPSPLPTTLQPTRVELADLDGDGHLDAVFSALDAGSKGSIATAHGDGASHFVAPVSQPLPSAAGSLLVGDLDGDGALDVASGCQVASGAGVVAVLHGNGAGGLLPAVLLPTSANAPFVDAADYDDDGVLDLVAGGSAGHVWLLRADGSGGYEAAQDVSAAESALSVFAADATDDGLPDVITWQPAAYGLAVLVGDGDGSLLGARRLQTGHPYDVEVLDINLDGCMDLLAVENEEGDVVRLLADGAGGFLPPKLTPLGSVGFSPRAVAAGDLDADGDADVVAASNKGLSLLRNDGAGGLLPATLVVGVPNGSDVELTDLDGDGDLDALLSGSPSSGPNSGYVVRCLGDGHAHLLSPQAFLAGMASFRLAVGDLDGDGQPDAVTANVQSSDLSILIGDGVGGFMTALSVPATLKVGDVALGDLDLDGALDAVAGQFGGELARFHGDGSGGLQLAEVVHTNYGFLLGGGVGVAIRDLDGDAWPDVLHTDSKSLTFLVRRNDGAGGMLPPQRFAAGDHVGSLAVADIDADGRPDVVACNYGASTIPGSLSLAHNAAPTFTWTDLGDALAGQLGPPQLVGTGELTPGSPGTLRLFRARPLSLAVILVSSGSTPAPFKGGVLVPVPPELMLTVVTDGIGAVSLGWLSWPSNAPGADWFFQVAVPDAEAVHGVALSNALKAVEP